MSHDIELIDARNTHCGVVFESLSSWVLSLDGEGRGGGGLGDGETTGLGG